MLTVPTSGHRAPRPNPHSCAVDFFFFPTIPVPLRTLRRLRRRRL